MAIPPVGAQPPSGSEGPKPVVPNIKELKIELDAILKELDAMVEGLRTGTPPVTEKEISGLLHKMRGLYETLFKGLPPGANIPGSNYPASVVIDGLGSAIEQMQAATKPGADLNVIVEQARGKIDDVLNPVGGWPSA